MAKVNWKGDAVAAKINEALLDGTEEWLTVNVKTNSVGRTPWQEGILAGSHTVQRSEREGSWAWAGPQHPMRKGSMRMPA